jgi:RimJ/RimL family protein N-acetyltransferase
MQSTGETDLGYRFHKRFWGKGYATESSILSLDYGFDTLPLTNVIARACNENVASIKVMQKLGMRFREAMNFNGLAGSVYEISNVEWQKKRSHLH